MLVDFYNIGDVEKQITRAVNRNKALFGYDNIL